MCLAVMGDHCVSKWVPRMFNSYDHFPKDSSYSIPTDDDYHNNDEN